MSLLVDDASKNGGVDQEINLMEQVYGGNESDQEGFSPRFHFAFVRQVDACDVLIGSQAGINAQARDGYD